MLRFRPLDVQRGRVYEPSSSVCVHTHWKWSASCSRYREIHARLLAQKHTSSQHVTSDFFFFLPFTFFFPLLLFMVLHSLESGQRRSSVATATAASCSTSSAPHLSPLPLFSACHTVEGRKSLPRALPLPRLLASAPPTPSSGGKERTHCCVSRNMTINLKLTSK